MAATSNLMLPEVLNHFNIYSDAVGKLIGQDADIELPELKMLTETIGGAGVLGEFEDSVTGQYESAQMKIKWTCLHKNFFSLMNTTQPSMLTLRGSVQMMDTGTGCTDYYPVKIVVKGKAKTVNLGKFEKGKKMECETEIEILYIKILVDKETLFELDKLNFKFVLNGEDMLRKIRSQV
ncbi:MAG TPA: phage tail protein [Lachnospiraceae bacterium]|nr:phage tail protein [Lachnospiraceae bacterium]